jgi:cytidine deaminase
MSLVELALDIRRNSYAPYSGYRVGAALEDEQGRLWTGVNVENVSYGASLCAERVAVTKMVSEGGRWVRRIAVATEDGGTPCGMCLQVLSEFSEPGASIQIEVLANKTGNVKNYRLEDLFPAGFSSSEVHRTL